MTQLTQNEKVIAKLLVEWAKNKMRKSYSCLTNELDKDYGIKLGHHYGLSKPLGNISTLCNELGLPLLSVRVMYKHDNSEVASGLYLQSYKQKP